MRFLKSVWIIASEENVRSVAACVAQALCNRTDIVVLLILNYVFIIISRGLKEKITICEVQCTFCELHNACFFTQPTSTTRRDASLLPVFSLYCCQHPVFSLSAPIRGRTPYYQRRKQDGDIIIATYAL